jgi:hypothetical protein
MYCSRDYISCKELSDFPLADRFFKLPVENFIANVRADNGDPIELNGPQFAIINAVNDPRHRFVVACVSRRVGKSFISFALAFLKALEPNNKILIVAPNYSLAGIGWLEIKKYIKQFGLKTVRDNAKDKEIELSNGTLIKLASAANADSAVGRSYDLIIFDEAALSDAGGDAFQIALRPTLDKPNSKAIFISTPRGSNWFKTFYEQGKSKDINLKNWVAIHGTWEDNPRASAKDIEQARLTNSDAYFRQEYLADFSTFEGRIFESFDVSRHVANLSDMDFTSDNFEAIMGIDPGYRDPTAAVVIQYSNEEDKFYLTWEYEAKASSTAQHALVFLPVMEEYNIDFCFVDYAAAQFRADLAYEYEITSNPANKAVNPGLDYMCMLLDRDMLVIDSRCELAVQAFINYRWDTRIGLLKEKPLHNEYSHIMDATRYALYSFTK